ncbi:MAG: HAMP domain-containing histidine kinase [Burkholderiaceae bacterium]|nr:HAMP domain-containing histidine kinase [Burkholderiaceae bacterium]
MNSRIGARPSLRRQLAWWFTALALVVAIAQAALVYWSAERWEEQVIDAVSAEQLRLSMAQYARDPALAAPNTADMRLFVYGPGQTAPLPEYLAQLPTSAGAYEIFPSPGIEYHVAVGERDGRRFYLVYDVAEHEQRQNNVLAILFASVIAIALAVLAGSDRIARRLTDDLERLSRAVRGESTSAARGESSVREEANAAPQRLLGLARHAESAELAAALDERRRRLDAALARERAFSAAASHELRTPLMQAVSTLDLLEAAPLEPQQQARAAQLRASLAEITRLTTGLLRAARGGAAGTQATEVAPLVDDVFSHLQPEARARAILLGSSVAAGARLAADRDVLWVVLVNLVRNAIRHSGGRQVDVQLDASTLMVSDDGHGFDATSEPSQRRRSGDEGVPSIGLGLSIVERICEGAGWTIAIDSDARRGTRVKVDFG